MELSEIRKKIDEIDAKLLPLFVERMQCAEQVAQTKKERGLPIFNAQREQEILDKVALSTPDFDCEAKMLYTVMMALSRARQHKLLHSGASVREEIERALQASPSPSVPKVACPGVFGSFSHEAAKSLLPNGEVQFYTGFPDIFQAIQTGGCRFGVVPVENSSAGSVAEVYDLLLHYRFHIVGAAVLQIRHCLAHPKGLLLPAFAKYTRIRRRWPSARSSCTARAGTACSTPIRRRPPKWWHRPGIPPRRQFVPPWRPKNTGCKSCGKTSRTKATTARGLS